MRKDLQEKGESHLVLSPFEYRTAVIFQALIPTLNAFQTWMGKSVLQSMQCQLPHWWSRRCLLFSFHTCWSNILPSFAVSDSPSNNVYKWWSRLEAVREFKVKDRFPSKSVWRNSMRDSQKVWWSPALLWLVKSRMMVEYDYHILPTGKSPHTLT